MRALQFPARRLNEMVIIGLIADGGDPLWQRKGVNPLLSSDYFDD